MTKNFGCEYALKPTVRNKANNLIYNGSQRNILLQF